MELTEEVYLLENQLDEAVQQLAEKGYAEITGFLSEVEVIQMLDVFQRHRENEALRPAGIGASADFQVNKRIRSDYIKWIEPEKAYPATQAYLNRILDVIGFLNRYCYLGIRDSEFHFAMYPAGGFYKRHLDQLKHNDHRRISCICYLNQNWQPEHGGLLRMYLPQPDGSEKIVDIAPTAGKFVLFRSDLIEHEVTPATKPRFSITGWLLDQEKELTFL